VRTFFWCLAVVASYCAGHYSVLAEQRMRYWRELQRQRQISSTVRRDNAKRGLLFFAYQLLCMLAALAFGLLATFGVAS
jgi:hypothetical protein